MPIPAPTPPAARRWFALALLPLAAPLAGCGGGATTAATAPACPHTAFLADAADLSRYRNNGRDLTDLVLDGRITGLSGRCAREQDGAVLRTEVTVRMEVARGPAAAGRSADLTYFVAATRGDQILDKRNFPVHVAFPANTERVRLSGEPLTLDLPTPQGVTGNAYRILVGFQLTPQELALNRERGPR